MLTKITYNSLWNLTFLRKFCAKNYLSCIFHIKLGEKIWAREVSKHSTFVITQETYFMVIYNLYCMWTVAKFHGLYGNLHKNRMKQNISFSRQNFWHNIYNNQRKDFRGNYLGMVRVPFEGCVLHAEGDGEDAPQLELLHPLQAREAGLWHRQGLMSILEAWEAGL